MISEMIEEHLFEQQKSLQSVLEALQANLEKVQSLERKIQSVEEDYQAVMNTLERFLNLEVELDQHLTGLRTQLTELQISSQVLLTTSRELS